MKKLLILALISCHPALAGWSGYVLFQTVPSKAGATNTAPYSLLINGTFPSFATTTNGGNVVNTVSCGVNSIVCPADLVFTLDSGCSVPFGGWDVLSYSPSTGQLIAEIELPVLSVTRPVKVYGCAGNVLVTAFQGGIRGAAYDNNYLLALHMDETSGTTLHDSTANANDAIKKAVTSPRPTTAGRVGGAQMFSGAANSAANDYALFRSLTAATSTWTVEYWTNALSYINIDSVFLGVQFMGFSWYPPGEVRYFNLHNNTLPMATSVAGAGSYHYIVYTRDGDTANVFVDGAMSPAASGFGTGTDQFRGLGWDGGANTVDSFNGALDEVYYSNISRSADYVTARFNNLSSPSTFYTVSPFTIPSPTLRSTTRANSQINIFVF